MLRANELMIGDWVIVYEKAMPVKARVDGVYGNNAFVLGHPRTVENGFVDPIPITPEILEKNFTRTEVRILSGTKTHYIESDDFYCVALNEYTDSIWELEYTNCEAHFPLVRVLVAHVHELQNALRLIGIDKTIEL